MRKFSRVLRHAWGEPSKRKVLPLPDFIPLRPPLSTPFLNLIASSGCLSQPSLVPSLPHNEGEPHFCKLEILRWPPWPPKVRASLNLWVQGILEGITDWNLDACLLHALNHLLCWVCRILTLLCCNFTLQEWMFRFPQRNGFREFIPTFLQSQN